MCNSKYSFGQSELKSKDIYYSVENIKVDTICLYDTLSGGPFCNYYVNWFFHSNCSENGAYHYIFYENVTEQDKLVFDSLIYYFKYYKNGKLYIEGLKCKDQFLIRDVKFYRENGTLEKIEHYNSYTYINEGVEFLLNDGAGPEGVWKYFDENGLLEKEITHQVIKEHNKLFRLKTIRLFDKNQEIKEINQEKSKI
ncbi:MAG TPA: hypothetical protein VIN73_10370 [Vicingaceae bacterium]